MERMVPNLLYQEWASVAPEDAWERDLIGPPPRIENGRLVLPDGLELTEKKRYDYYGEVKSPETALVIATGEQRRFANLLLTIGVIKEGEQ